MKDLFCIILAGGIGSRFYPLSNNNEPKQFLDFFNEKESLISRPTILALLKRMREPPQNVRKYYMINARWWEEKQCDHAMNLTAEVLIFLTPYYIYVR